MAEILIGTSGWSYKSWQNRFYPSELPVKDDLHFYADEFPTVEINSSFYRLPKSTTFTSWSKQVPKDFIFSVKASRFLTHMKRLKDPFDPWDRIMNGASHLKGKLGPILLQFPYRWTKNLDRLTEFFDMLKSERDDTPRLVFELRHESWQSKDVMRLLEENDAAWCIADSNKFKRKDAVTTDFAYFRFHGRTDAKAPNYTDAELKKEAAKMKRMRKNGTDVLAYFNNDAEGYAIKNAQALMEMVA